jgi:uncharacterized caspase-like protein
LVPLVWLVVSATAQADDTPPLAAPLTPPLAAPAAVVAASPIATYALVVGSNTGGPGQTELRYAEDDARRVGDVLVELGGYSRAQVDVAVHPTSEQLRGRLAELASRVQADVAAGRQARVFFYYSGHARAAAIDLGSEELPLAELRARLFAVPATLTIVVLDACQSGAFARVKGAAPAADFSTSSREHLDASGVAVLASSSATELSQESEELHSSYFTHHLLVGLRGAGDANGDGQVSIDEAYRYAYHQTLLATAQTAVGGQHVTFEAELKGHGEVPLSFPRAATAAIALPARLEGQALVEDKRAHVVVAELYKAKGAPVRIAVAPGDYAVIVRSGTTVSRCDVDAYGEIDLDRCRREVAAVAATKGGARVPPATRIELAGHIGPEIDDAFTKSLTTFGYQQQFLSISQGGAVAVTRSIWRPDDMDVWLGGELGATAMPEWTRPVAGTNLFERFFWQDYTALAVIGAQRYLSRRWSYGARVAAGVDLGATELYDATAHRNLSTYLGPAASAQATLRVDDIGVNWFGWRGIGAAVGIEADGALGIHDLIGNSHVAGGSRALFSLSYTYGGAR